MKLLYGKHRPLIVPQAHTVAPVARGLHPVDFRAMGILPSIFGGAKGYNTEGDILTQTVDGRSLNEVWAEFQRTLQIHNEFRTNIVQLLTFPVTQPIEDVPQISGDDFEEASEFGEPKGFRQGDYFSLGYDFKWYDVGQRLTWKFLSEATAQQVEALGNTALEMDNRLVFNKVLKAIFNNVNRVATIRQQAINVYPFYNGDATVPPAYKNFVHTAPHTHYLVSGAANVDSGDLNDIETHLKHHGYGRQQGSRMILMVNSQESAIISAFRVATGARWDFIPAQGEPPFLLPTNTGGIQGGQIPNDLGGLFVTGRYGPWIVIEEDYIPAGYILGFATGGQQVATNPVGIRQHANASMRGLKLLRGQAHDYPLVDAFYQRGFGTGVRHRGAGVVMQVKAAGAYEIPAAYV